MKKPALVALLVVAWATGMTGVAYAQNETLDVEPEQQTVDNGVEVTLTAEAVSPDPLPGSPAQVTVDFEITSGPNANLDPAGPDMTCDTQLLAVPPGTCTVTYMDGANNPAAPGNVDTIMAWIDLNQDDMVPGEADENEGRDEDAAAGDTPEPDNTDVVEVTFEGAAAAGPVLNTEPETSNRPPNGTQTLTATVTEDGQPVENANVDFTKTAGPGNLSAPECDTAANGMCSVDLVGTGTAGTATVRSWIDGTAADNDDMPNEADTAESRDETTTAGTTEEPDGTDVVEVTFGQAQEDGLDVEPETSNQLPDGTQTLTATVMEAGEPVENANVDFEKTEGPGELSATECDTGADGTCSVDLNGDGTEGAATVRSWIDGTAAENDDMPDEADANEGRDEATTPGDTEEPDDTDVVEVTFGEDVVDGTCPGHADEPGNHIVGTQEPDMLTGTPDRDVICGLGDDDEILGGGGNDLLLGGAGNDMVRGGPGADDIRGGPGGDDLGGQAGNDAVRGGGGADTVRGWAGNDELYGNGGGDKLVGGPPNARPGDFCNSGRGNSSAIGCERGPSA